MAWNPEAKWPEKRDKGQGSLFEQRWVGRREGFISGELKEWADLLKTNIKELDRRDWAKVVAAGLLFAAGAAWQWRDLPGDVSKNLAGRILTGLKGKFKPK